MYSLLKMKGDHMGNKMGKKVELLLAAILTFVIAIGSMGRMAYAENRYNRIWGKDRYLTAVEISKNGWVLGSQNVVLAYGEDFPDALCAVPLAKMLNAPILLTDYADLNKAVSDEIIRLGAKNVYIIGGTGVISAGIEDTLNKTGLNCTRLGGEDRYKTSLTVAEYMAKTFTMSSEMAIVTGEDFPDALSIASIAGIRKMPILLSTKEKLSDEAKSYITKHNTTVNYIVGGEGVISNAVEKDVVNHKRLSGSNRYETNIAVLNWFMNSITFNSTYIATGEDFPDALSGAALAAINCAPVLLVSPSVDKVTRDFVADNRLLIKDMTALGGEAVVSAKSIEPLLPKITSIADINEFIVEGDNFNPPQNIKASMDNGTIKDVSVSWDKGIDDNSNGMKRIYKGMIKGYADKVTLTLEIRHTIMGKSVLTAEQMAGYLLSKNPSPSIDESCTPLELARLFIEEGEAEGVRGDIAFAQSLKETNYFKFTGDAKPEWNNYGGLGVTGGTDPVTGEPLGLKFNSPREGVRAQIQHLKAYGSTEPLKQACIDPRYTYVKKGSALYWEWLGKLENPNDVGWAWPGENYGHSLISLYFLPMKDFK